jgi:hypothetical protein
MSINSTVSKVQYTLTLANQTLAVPFYFLEDTHLKVIKVAASQTTLTQITHYTVTGAGNQAGGQVILTGTATAIGDVITILRNAPATQLVDYITNGKFPADTQERALDKLTMLAQQLIATDVVGLRFQEGEVLDGTLVKSARSGKVFTFDANGAPAFVTGGSLTTEGVASAAASAAAAAGSATLAASFQARITFATMAEASAASVTAISTGEVAFIRAFSVEGDKGHGMFRLDKASTATLNAGMVIAAAGGGRWLRLYEGEINICWMGARDGVDISPILQSVIDANQAGCTIYIPANGYYMGSTVFITGQAQRIRGDGANQGGTTIYWNGANGGWMFENNFIDNTIEHICLTGNSKLSNGIRNRGNPNPTTKTHKRAKYDRLWIRSFDTGMSFERASGSGLTQCDSTGIYATNISDCNIGLLINSGDADYISVFNSEIVSCTTAGVRLSWGGSLQLRNIVFASNAIDVESPIGSNGMEALVLDSCQGEAQTSGTMLSLRATIQQVSLRDCIFNGRVLLGCGGSVVSHNNSFAGATGNLEMVADNQQIYQFFDRFSAGAAFIDSSPTPSTTSRIYARSGLGFRLESFPLYVKPVNGSQRVIEAQAASGQSGDMLRLTGNGGNPFRVDSLNRLIIGGYAPPTVTVGANAGTGASVNSGGFDNSGFIEVTTGTSPSIGVLASISFTTLPSAPRFMFAPANAFACALPVFATSATATGCDISCATAPTASRTYQWHYWAVSQG